MLKKKIVLSYDARILHLRESTDIGYVPESVLSTHLYLNLCSYTYISFSKNVVPYTDIHIGYLYVSAPGEHRFSVKKQLPWSNIFCFIIWVF
jgi:hypothetical protein